MKIHGDKVKDGLPDLITMEKRIRSRRQVGELFYTMLAQAMRGMVERVEDHLPVDVRDRWREIVKRSAFFQDVCAEPVVDRFFRPAVVELLAAIFDAVNDLDDYSLTALANVKLELDIAAAQQADSTLEPQSHVS